MHDLTKFIAEKLQKEDINKEFKGGIHLLLDALLKDGTLTKRSFNHPFGFIQIKIIDFGNQFPESLRLHIWPFNRIIQRPQYLIHSHAFDFTSYVICGKISNSIYEITPTENSEDCLYEVDYNDEKSTSTLIKTERRVLCKLVNQETMSTGQHYKMYKNMFHSSDIEENVYTATLFTTSNRQHGTSVLGNSSGSERYVYLRNNVEQGVLHAELDRIKNIIK
jgi:hypothetical protein